MSINVSCGWSNSSEFHSAIASLRPDIGMAYEMRFVRGDFLPAAKEFVIAHYDHPACSSALHINDREMPEGLSFGVSHWNSSFKTHRSLAECWEDHTVRWIA